MEVNGDAVSERDGLETRMDTGGCQFSPSLLGLRGYRSGKPMLARVSRGVDLRNLENPVFGGWPDLGESGPIFSDLTDGNWPKAVYFKPMNPR